MRPWTFILFIVLSCIGAQPTFASMGTELQKLNKIHRLNMNGERSEALPLLKTLSPKIFGFPPVNEKANFFFAGFFQDDDLEMARAAANVLREAPILPIPYLYLIRFYFASDDPDVAGQILRVIRRAREEGFQEILNMEDHQLSEMKIDSKAIVLKYRQDAIQEHKESEGLALAKRMEQERRLALRKNAPLAYFCGRILEAINPFWK